MKKRNVLGIFISIVLICVSGGIAMAQERVYVSTDKDVYVAGEDLWFSVYCIDESTGKFSNMSDMAYLQFVSREGVAATQKVALINGRGCGVFQVPLEFGTGNYSIVSYTKCDGGDAVFLNGANGRSSKFHTFLLHLIARLFYRQDCPLRQSAIALLLVFNTDGHGGENPEVCIHRLKILRRCGNMRFQSPANRSLVKDMGRAV